MVRLRTWLGAVRRTLLEDLFPEPLKPVDGGRPARGALLVLGAAAAVALLIALSLLRQDGNSALDSIWAEDGSVFLRQAREAPLTDVLFDAYAGYLHVVPRVLAEVAASVPIARAAQALALLGAAATALCALVVYAATAGHLHSRGLRALLAGLLVLQPAAALESLNTLALAQWHLVAAGFWVALWRPRSWAGSAAAAAFLALTALSAPLAFVLLPIALVRLLVVPSWRDRVPALSLLAAAAVQAWALLSFPAPGESAGTAGELAHAYALRVVQPAVVGLRLAERLAPVDGGLLLRVCVALAAAVVLVAVLRRGGGHRLTVLLAAVTSVVAFTGSAWLRGVVPLMLPDAAVPFPPTQSGFPASRFVLLPTLLLYAVLALALDGRPRRVPEEFWEPLRAVAVGLVLLVAGIDFLTENDRSIGPRWVPEVAGAVEACRAGATEVELQVTPDFPDFRLPAACEDLPP